MKEQRDKLSVSARERKHDGRNIHSSIMRLEDALASFQAESKELELAIEEIPRILERVSLAPNQAGAMVPGMGAAPGVAALPGVNPALAGAIVPAMGSTRPLAAAIDVPLPYFQTLAQRFEERTQQIWERVNAVESSLIAYSRQSSGVPVESQIEAVVRSQHAQFRALAAQVAQTAERLEQLREMAVRTKGVQPGMIARQGDYGWRDGQWAALDQMNAAGLNGLQGPGLGGMPPGAAGALGMGGGLGGLGGMGGGLGGLGMGGMQLGGGLGAGGMQLGGGLGAMGQNPGGGLFGQNA